MAFSPRTKNTTIETKQKPPTHTTLSIGKVDKDLVYELGQLLKKLDSLDLETKVATMNQIKRILHKYSPFKEEPVDCVVWIKGGSVQANDYNPNAVAPPEMKLLEHSVMEDGFTQPIVAWKNTEKNIHEVVDGFHRNRVGKECKPVINRLHGYLPLTIINSSREDRGDRIAATIRHNRARGKHQVEAMSDIVIELKKRNWSDERISKELGMDSDEVLRLCQISGLTEVFGDADFSQAWDATIFTDEEEQHISEDDIECINESKVSPDRILHKWDKWECYPAGFYENKPPNGLSEEECELTYRDFLANIPLFDESLQGVIRDWKHSCEHYLTNERMNRIAWLGQAAVCWKYRIPSRFCGGYNLLTPEQKQSADEKALEYLNKWLSSNGRNTLEMTEAQSKTMMDLY